MQLYFRFMLQFYRREEVQRSLNSETHFVPSWRRSCKICPRLEGERNCQVTAPVYRITCNICREIYIGETGRTAKDRFGEHLRYATSPTAKSYSEMAFAVHYRQYHDKTEPDLTFEIIITESRILYRKIIEAYYINREKPAINLKEELTDLCRFLIS